jgi:membrane-bound lytic murein transglycosylase A
VIRDDLGRESLLQAIRRSREFFARLPENQLVGERPRRVTARQGRESLAGLMDVLKLWGEPEKMAAAIRSRFDIVPSARQEILLTGYYRPEIEGSLTETPVYRFPIYRKPDDIIEAEPADSSPPRGENILGRAAEKRLVPYFSRYEIDALGKLRGKGYEIAWVKDPVELFFLHIQGSGIVRLPDGRTLQLNYAAANGRPYTSIGKILIEEGKISAAELSAARLRDFLKHHPEEREALLARNERYIFFRFVTNGPLGSLEVPLTPGRSIAADPDYFPKGAPALLVSRRPILDSSGNLTGWRPFSRFVLSQDSGAAIRGPGRLDLYFGSGAAAGDAAGFMKSGGAIYLLVGKKTARK